MPAMALCKTMYVEKKEISNEQEDTQISEIDDLMEKKCEALIQKDNTKCEDINNELEEKGVETMSISQIIKLTGEVPKLDSDGKTELNLREDSAATYQTKDFNMGRTLDYEFSYGEEVTITPRYYEFDFRYAGKAKTHYALIGMAFVAGDYPLYYDAANE